MADAKITALPELTSMSDDDLFVVVDNPSGAPTSKKITKANLFSSIPSTDTTYNATSPITIVGTTIAIPKATTSEDGYISSTDWDTFNDKISYTTATTVDANATFRATPSTVITAGANLTWDGNTLNAVSGTSAGANHADLENLDYANAGHTGFVSTATLTTHTSSSAIHFLESAIDHTNITNIGTNAHTAIDTHIASASIHAVIPSENALFKYGTSTYTDDDVSQTFTESFCSTTAFVSVQITGTTEAQGTWTVFGSSGSFRIDSDTAESADIPFNYFITKN